MSVSHLKERKKKKEEVRSPSAWLYLVIRGQQFPLQLLTHLGGGLETAFQTVVLSGRARERDRERERCAEEKEKRKHMSNSEGISGGKIKQQQEENRESD